MKKFHDDGATIISTHTLFSAGLRYFVPSFFVFIKFVGTDENIFSLHALGHDRNPAEQRFHYFLRPSRELFSDRRNRWLCLCLAPRWTPVLDPSVCFAQHPLIRQEASRFAVCTFGETGFSRIRSIFHCIGALKYPEEFHWLVTTLMLLC